MRHIFSIIILMHGLIHFMGFAKAFHFAKIEQLTKDISKPLGILWLLTGLLFIISIALYLAKRDLWPFLTIVAVIISQILIFIFWKDAKFGTIANIIILMVGIVSWASNNFESTYKKDVAKSFSSIPKTFEVVKERDLAHLPKPVQNYLNYVGVVGRPKVHSFKITFEGEMRDKGKDWFTFTSEQYNFIKDPTRLFFIKAKVKGLPTTGYHDYKDGEASMLIKVLSLVPVVDIDGPEMFKAETVTFFNDLCLFAPSALVDESIRWETIDEQSARAFFNNNGVTVSAILYVNEKGQLVNFVSNDRYSIEGMSPFPFSTPIKNYQEINGRIVPTYGETIWHYPDGEFVYGKFRLKSIEYNVLKVQ